MMADSNKWGGGEVHCVGCQEHTLTPAYVGRLKCCKLRVGMCGACRKRLPEVGLGTPAQAVTAWSREHARHCGKSVETIAKAEGDRWADKTRSLYLRLAETIDEFMKEHRLPEHGTQTALILLCRAFCETNSVTTESFTENFLTGFEEAKASVAAAKPTKISLN